MILVVICSIPIKIWFGELRHISLFKEIMTFKNWVTPIILFFIIFNFVETEKDCNQVIIGLLILLVMTLLTMILVSFDVMQFGKLKVMEGEYSAGRSSGFGNPVEYASYLVLFLPLILSFLLFQKKLFKRAAIAVLLLMVFLGLIIAGSRGGILSFLISLMVYFTVLIREKMIRRTSIIFVGMALILFSLVSFSLAPSQVKRTLEKKIDPNFGDDLNVYTSGRTLIWRFGFDLFIESPIYGHGQNSFVSLMEQRFGIRAASHNQYLEQMVEYGIIGLAIYIMILIKIYQLVWHQIKISTEFRIKVLYVSYFAGFCGYAFSLLGVNAINTRFLFWIYAAIIYRYAEIVNKKDKKIDIIPKFSKRYSL